MYIITTLDYKIIDTLPTLEIVDDKWVRSNKGSLIQLDMVIVSEVTSLPENAKYYKDGKFTRRHPDIVKKDKESIQEQLDDLDKKASRDAEDIYDLLVKQGIIKEGETPDLPFVKQRREEKKALRLQLKGLE